MFKLDILLAFFSSYVDITLMVYGRAQQLPSVSPYLDWSFFLPIVQLP